MFLQDSWNFLIKQRYSGYLYVTLDLLKEMHKLPVDN